MSECYNPSSTQQRRLKHLNANSIVAIKENPYLLIAFGMPFDDTDKLVEAIANHRLNGPQHV
ncbi:hypothetical protein [Pseudoalteromonas sp. 5-MNA-CIBAN-0065]|uniref:hypothetical protein n=1 Tax=unclassified Pseudoalteromonas TaxID=194690 RepID=UPI003329DDF6